MDEQKPLNVVRLAHTPSKDMLEVAEDFLAAVKAGTVKSFIVVGLTSSTPKYWLQTFGADDELRLAGGIAFATNILFQEWST